MCTPWTTWGTTTDASNSSQSNLSSSSSNSHNDKKKGKIVPSYDMKYPKNNYVSFHVNEWMNEWYGLDLWCCILNFELLRLVSIDIWQEIRILEHYTILWSSTDLGCSWIINPKTILSKLKNTQASFSSKMFGWWKRLKSRCSLAKYEKMQTRLIEPNWVS